MAQHTLSPLELQLKGYRLATAEILYRLPDTQSILQSYIWQDFDQTPDFPVLKRFLEFWERKLDGPLHSVSVTSCEVITPSEYQCISASFSLN